MVVAVAVLLLATFAAVGAGVGLLLVEREIAPLRRACADTSAALVRARGGLARDRAALTTSLDGPGDASGPTEGD